VLTGGTVTTGPIRLASVTAHATSHGDTVSISGHLIAIAAAAATTATTRIGYRRPGRRQRHRISAHRRGHPGEDLPHPASRPGEPAKPPAHRVRRDPQQPRDPPVRRPRAAAASAAPITPASSGRRTSSRVGNSTCVTPHPRHRDRRGRTTCPRRPGPKITRSRACPHGASRPPPPGQQKPPSFSIRSTPGPMPTVRAGAPLHPHAALPGASPKITGRAAQNPTRSPCRRAPLPATPTPTSPERPTAMTRPSRHTLTQNVAEQGRFARAEPPARVREYVSGLVAGLERKNGWTLAEWAGEVSPDGMQRLLRRADWEVDGVHDDVRDYVIEQHPRRDHRHRRRRLDAGPVPARGLGRPAGLLDIGRRGRRDRIHGVRVEEGPGRHCPADRPPGPRPEQEGVVGAI
jgi:hypothetical protein